MTKLKALLTLDEAATDLAVSKTTLRRWTNDGRLPRSRRDQSKWPWSGRILPVSLWQFVERKAKLIETTHTGPGYRLYALADNSPAKPGLVFDDTGPGAIEVEVWEMEEGSSGRSWP